MNSEPTGRREIRNGTGYVVYTREFRAPVADVWAAVIEPEWLVRRDDYYPAQADHYRVMFSGFTRAT